MSSVHCNIAPPAAVRLLESEGCHFSKFTVLGFLPSKADASVIPRHVSVHLGQGDLFFQRLLHLIWRVPYKNRFTSGPINLLTTHVRFLCREVCLLPQIALLRTWAVEEQCKFKPLQMYYFSNTH